MPNESNRFAESLTRRIKHVYGLLIKGYAYFPAGAKIGAMMGSAVFNAIKFSGYVLHVKDGLSTPFGIALAIEQAQAAMVDTTITRARGMVRQSWHEQKKDAEEDQSPADEENSVGPPEDDTNLRTYLTHDLQRLHEIQSEIHSVPPPPNESMPESKPPQMNGHHIPNGLIVPYSNGIVNTNGIHTNGIASQDQVMFGFLEEDIEESKQINLYKDATLCYPGVDDLACGQSFCYRLLQVLSIMYMCNSATSGFLSTFSLVDLISRAPGFEFDGKCEEGESELWKVLLVNFMAIYLAYCSIVSFSKYNLDRIQTYYGTLFIKGNEPGATRGEIFDIRWHSYLTTLVSVSINTVGIAFTGMHTWDLLGDQALCHIGIPLLPYELKLFLVAQACLTNFTTNGIMTLVAVHNRDSGKFKRNIVELLKGAPSFTKWHPFISTELALYSLNIALGTSVAVAQLPETLDKTLEGFCYNPGMIFLGILTGLIALKSQYSLSMEGYQTELAKTGVDNAKKVLLDAEREDPNNSLTRHLIDDSLQTPLPRHQTHAFDVVTDRAQHTQGVVGSVLKKLSLFRTQFSTHRVREHPNNMDIVSVRNTALLP